MSNRKTSKQNLLLKKQDIILIKKSEEVKNTEIYGNLYACLEPYTVLSYKDFQKDIVFDDKARLSLTRNIKTMMDHVKAEWYAKTSFEIATTEVHCQLCGAKNTYVCYIANRINGEELHVGKDCVTKYKDINGANVILTQLRSGQRNITKELRQNNFDIALGNDIDFTKQAKKKIEEFPIVLPYKLHTDIIDAITSCNRIRTSYVSSGGDIDEYINKFMVKKLEFESLYDKANHYYQEIKNNPLICTKEIADWLKNNYPTIITDIQKSKGILNENTLQFVHEPNFIITHLSMFSSCLKDKDIQFLTVSGNVIRFKIENERFLQPIYFTMPIKNFMKNIGCHCLVQSGYRFSKLNLSPSIENSYSNFNNVLNYFIGILNNTEYTIFLEEKTLQLYWEKRQTIKNRWSNNLITLNPIYKPVTVDKVLTIMSNILLIESSEKEIINIIVNRIQMNGRWITKEEKDRNVQIASEAAGMQKQREFTPYL